MTTPLPPVVPPARRRVAPKAQGAWLGAGTGEAAASTIVQIVQAFTRHPLDPGLVQAVYLLCSAGLAFTGAYLAPRQDPLPPA